MEVFTASLTADNVRVALLTAHTHASDERDPAWEILDLEKAISNFKRLAEQMPAVEARLAGLVSAKQEA